MESYFNRCASVLVSVRSLAATNSILGRCKPARTTLRPMRPKPLMPTLMDMPLQVLFGGLFGNQRRRRRPANVGVSFLDPGYFGTGEGHKSNLTGRIAIDPVLGFGAIARDVAFLVAGLGDREQDLVAIHPYDDFICLDGVLDRLWQFFDVIVGRGLRVEIEDGRQDLLDVVGLDGRNRP